MLSYSKPAASVSWKCSHSHCIGLKFLSISKFNSNVNNINISNSQSSVPTINSRPSVKDPIINGIKMSLIYANDGYLVPKLEEFEVSKLELSKTFGFELRDLRALHNIDGLKKDINNKVSHKKSHKYDSPTFFIRHSAFLAHLKDITALISSDQCYLFNVFIEDNSNNDYDSDSEQDTKTNNIGIIATDSFNILNKFKAKLQSTLIFNTLPFEFHCLEAVCKAVVSKHRNHVIHIENICDDILNERIDDKLIQSNISLIKLQLIQAITSAKSLVDAVNELLNNSDDLQEMYLTERNQTIRDDKRLELLLENYLWQFDEILDRLQLLLDEISMYERSYGFKINQKRNEIIKMNLKLSVLTCGFASGALYSSIFGMNLLSTFESHPYAFWCAASGFGLMFPFAMWRHFKIHLQSKDIHI